MPKAPQPNQKRYRGRIRADMRSALFHLRKLSNWNIKFNGKPITYYPNQLAAAADMGLIVAAAVQLSQWLTLKGPIPSR
jgi:hypothetical protein